MLVSMWITIRGFAFASAFAEMYKQEKRRDSNGPRHLEKILISPHYTHTLQNIQCYNFFAHITVFKELMATLVFLIDGIRV